MLNLVTPDLERPRGAGAGWLRAGRHEVRFVRAEQFRAGASEGVNLHFQDGAGGRARASCHLSSAPAAQFFHRFLEAVCRDAEVEEFRSGEARRDMGALLRFLDRLADRPLAVAVEARADGRWHEVRRFGRAGSAPSPPAGEATAADLGARIKEVKQGYALISEAGEYKATIEGVPARMIKGKEQLMLRLRTEDGEVVETFLNARALRAVEDAMGEEFTEESIGKKIGVCVTMRPGAGRHEGRSFPRVEYFMPPGNILNETTLWRGPDLTPPTPEQEEKRRAQSSAEFGEMVRGLREADARKETETTT